MNFELNITPTARKGIEKIRRSGSPGVLRQVRKTLKQLSDDPSYPALNTHRLKGETRFGRDDLWVSHVRQGPGGERIVWAYPGESIQVIDVEYIGKHLD